MKEDLIRRSDAIKAVEAHIESREGYNFNDYEYGRNQAFETAIIELEDLPSADRPQGEWIAKDGVFYCSCCDNDSAGLSEDDVYVYERPLPNYCQDCGAKMEGADDE